MKKKADLAGDRQRRVKNMTLCTALTDLYIICENEAWCVLDMIGYDVSIKKMVQSL